MIANVNPVCLPNPPIPKIRFTKDGVPAPVISDPEEYDQWLSDLARVMGTNNPNTAVMLLQQALNAAQSGKDQTNREIVANTVISLIAEMNPKSSAELMLAVQILAVHFKAMRLMQQASLSSFPETSRKLINLATRMMRTYTQQMEALRKFQQRGRQKMTVEHVHVHNGGQAVVGTVENHTEGRDK